MNKNMDYNSALIYANEVMKILFPFCERIDIAGGIRRKKQDPHDIEIVLKPTFLGTVTLFDDSGPDVNYAHIKILELVKNGVFQNGDPDKRGARAPCGEKYYRLKYKGEKLDIFSVVEPAQYGVILAIRTGDAEFSHALVQQGWKYGIRVIDGHLERRGVTINTEEEKDVFSLLGIEWIEPEKRIGPKAITKVLEVVKQN